MCIRMTCGVVVSIMFLCGTGTYMYMYNYIILLL